ncbi:MAG: family 4 glycosyl hydrolase [Anaerolineae bacterium]
MADRKTIVLIGAGSAAFTQGLLADFIRAGKSWELRLVDVDPKALKTAEGLAQRMVEVRKADVTVKSSTDRREMLPGADVVVTTIGVGGRRGWEADVIIPRKYGVYQPVGDTIMSGGVSRAMRMIPAMIDIANDVAKYAPNAWFFNYANPMTANCWAMRKATKANVVGLCIGTIHVVWELADLLGVPRDEVSALAAGVNHFTWIYDLRWKGQDAWPLIRDAVAQERARGDLEIRKDVAPGGDTTMAERGWRHVVYNPFSWSLFDAYGAYPAVNDRHVVEFWPERFPQGKYQGKTLGIETMVFEDVIHHGDAHYENMRRQAAGEIPLDQAVFDRGVGEHSQLTEIIDSIGTDDRKMYFANLPNRGAVPNLPYDAVLEMSSVATARGLTPVRAIGYSDALAAAQTRKIAGIEVTVEAALSGSRNLFVEALLMDGSVTDRGVAEKMADELIAAHKHNLPQFA